MSRDPENKKSTCAKCNGNFCYPILPVNDPLPPLDKAPISCPMKRFPEVMEKTAGQYEHREIREFSRLASIQEAQCYELTPEGIRTKIPRLEETIQFVHKCGYSRIGLAFCVGLREEARMVTTIFENNDFEVVSVNCKVGRIPKEFIGIEGREKILGPELMEPMCNPIAQAEILNNEDVDLAVLLGLCVGHDTLFLKYCKVPCTVLAVKDRVLGHNPLAALYLSKGPYYSRINNPVRGKVETEKVILP